MEVAKAGSSPTDHEFWVLAVERYLPDEARSYRYDVTLCGGALDERAPLKYLLAPQLNRLVQRNDLRSGCRLRVGRLWARADGVKVMERVEVLRTCTPPPLLTAAQPVSRPLLGPTSYYLPLWEESDYYGEEWTVQSYGQEQVSVEGDQHLSSIIDDF
ncbi:RPA-related protein RADX-like [Pristis pectinata]|uniref:RPA-related protein RADX-like n=1 Tax=Pristis pectinata TaxID=685728 RepID=UPI00223D1618|nr:RPA-related protein RADX-like [Pristis pectinata]